MYPEATTVNDLKNIPMLYRRAPFDSYHAHILDEIQSGRVSPLGSSAYFNMPGIGFHRSIWILTNHVVKHRALGQQTFVVPPGMQRALGRTSLAGVGAEEVKFPFSSLYVALPGYTKEIWGGGQTKWHQIRGVFVWHEVGERCMVNPAAEEASFPEEDRGMLHLYIWGEENAASQHQGDDASMWFALDLNESESRGEDLEQYLSRVLGDRSREVHDYNPELPQDLASAMGLAGIPVDAHKFERQKAEVVDAIRVVFNTLLYLSSTGAEVEEDPSTATAKVERADIEKQLGRMKNLNKGKAKRLKKRLLELPTDTVTWVGRSVAARTAASPGARGSGSAQRSHWVRGHWWPRKDTIRNRLLKAHKEAAPAVARYYDLEAEGNDPEGLVAARKRVEELEKKIADLESSLLSKRRWVMPYKKGSAGPPPASHTYVIQEK